MHTALPLLATFLLLLGSACGQPIAQSRTSPLDYAELRGNDGWYLKVHGDGSGTLTHRQHPLHHLDYPARTFELPGIVRVAAGCGGDRSASGPYALTVYHSASDQTHSCRSIAGSALDEAMAMAIANMQLAVDDVRSERSCRMLRRAWLASAN